MIDLETTGRPDIQDSLQRGGWRNRYFMRSGRGFWGANIWPTKAEAENQAADWFRQTRESLAEGGFEFVEWDGALVLLADFTHAIPMPWRDDDP